MGVPFTKMHGLGNDFIVVEDLKGEYSSGFMKKLSQNYCRRRFGIGGDDILYIGPADGADASMRIFEPNGTEADMCGNGIRCVADYLYQQGYDTPIKVDTRAGVKTIRRNQGMYDVNMGQCQFPRNKFTVYSSEQPLLEEELDIGESVYRLSGVNTGEPHLAMMMEDLEDDLDNVEVSQLGRRIRNSKHFPDSGVNVNFVQIEDEGYVQARVYERGVEDETMACGTGATAVAALVHRLRNMNDRIEVEMPGGTVEIMLNDDLQAWMRGPAERVFEGEIPEEIEEAEGDQEDPGKVETEKAVTRTVMESTEG